MCLIFIKDLEYRHVILNLAHDALGIVAFLFCIFSFYKILVDSRSGYLCIIYIWDIR